MNISLLIWALAFCPKQIQTCSLEESHVILQEVLKSGLLGVRAMESTKECIYYMDTNPWKCSFLICETSIPKTSWHMIKLWYPSVFKHFCLNDKCRLDQLVKKCGMKNTFPCGNSSSESTITWIFKRFVNFGSILQCLEIRMLQRAFRVWLQIRKRNKQKKTRKRKIQMVWTQDIIQVLDSQTFS